MKQLKSTKIEMFRAEDLSKILKKLFKLDLRDFMDRSFVVDNGESWTIDRFVEPNPTSYTITDELNEILLGDSLVDFATRLKNQDPSVFTMLEYHDIDAIDVMISWLMHHGHIENTMYSKAETWILFSW